MNNAFKELHQASIHSACKCTPAYTSKVLKKLIKKGIVKKNYKNSVFVKNPLILSFQLAFNQDMVKPVKFSTPSFKDVKKTLQATIYSITLNSAFKVLKGEKPKEVHAYVLGRDIELIHSTFPQVKKGSNLLVYPCDHFKFLKQELIKDVFTVTKEDLFTDLIRQGEMKKGFELVEKYKLFNL